MDPHLKKTKMKPPREIRGHITRMVYDKYETLEEDQQRAFLQEFYRKKKSIGLGYLCWFFFGLHYAYVGKWGIQLLFWLTGGGFLVWLIIDLFRIPGIVRNYNADHSSEIMRNVVALR